MQANDDIWIAPPSLTDVKPLFVHHGCPLKPKSRDALRAQNRGGWESVFPPNPFNN